MSPPLSIQPRDSKWLRPRRITRGARWIWSCNVQGAVECSGQREPRGPLNRGWPTSHFSVPFWGGGRTRCRVWWHPPTSSHPQIGTPTAISRPAGGHLLILRDGRGWAARNGCALGVPVEALPARWLAFRAILREFSGSLLVARLRESLVRAFLRNVPASRPDSHGAHGTAPPTESALESRACRAPIMRRLEKEVRPMGWGPSGTASSRSRRAPTKPDHITG